MSGSADSSSSIVIAMTDVTSRAWLHKRIAASSETIDISQEASVCRQSS